MSDHDEAIVKIAEIFNALNIPYVVVGASARDIFCKEFGLPKAIRKTADVDFGIFVKDWEELKRVEETLKNNKKINKGDEKENKVRYVYEGTPFDIVPFGGIEKDGKVSWPPFYDTIMTVIGYEEALGNAVKIGMKGSEIKVVCVEILIALKLIAWNENRSRQKDIQDSWFLMSEYSKIDPSSYDYIIENYIQLIEKFDHEVELAEPIHIGIKQKKLLNSETTKLLISILENQKSLEKMAMVALEGATYTEDRDTELEKVQGYLKALLAGLSN